MFPILKQLRCLYQRICLDVHHWCDPNSNNSMNYIKALCHSTVLSCYDVGYSADRPLSKPHVLLTHNSSQLKEHHCIAQNDCVPFGDNEHAPGDSKWKSCIMPCYSWLHSSVTSADGSALLIFCILSLLKLIKNARSRHKIMDSAGCETLFNTDF